MVQNIGSPTDECIGGQNAKEPGNPFQINLLLKLPIGNLPQLEEDRLHVLALKL